ncbi:hypothetical protein ACA910_014961 [Epithemia clementina (nom. ined.)]
MRFSLVWIVPRTAAAVGQQLGSVALAGFFLGSLVGNLTCLSILEGSLTAADTFVPRAFGAQDYREVARLVVRATLVGAVLLTFFAIPLWFGSQPLLNTLLLWTMGNGSSSINGDDEYDDGGGGGENNHDDQNDANYNGGNNKNDYYYYSENEEEEEEMIQDQLQAAALAQQWVRIYLAGAPANLLFRVLARFLLAQQKPWALVVASVVPSLVLHDWLWIPWLIPTFGFAGSAWSLVATQWTMLLTLLALLGWGSWLSYSSSSTKLSATPCGAVTTNPSFLPPTPTTTAAVRLAPISLSSSSPSSSLGLSSYVSSHPEKQRQEQQRQQSPTNDCHCGAGSSSLFRFQQQWSWLLSHCLSVHPQTWPQLTSRQFWKESCGDWSKVVQYVSLAVGGVLSFNEWWFSEIMTITAGQFGVDYLDAHTIA